jgi:peptidoglycan/xylan/chitin deacetylase (PgdA/CDA1 family)
MSLHYLSGNCSNRANVPSGGQPDRRDFLRRAWQISAAGMLGTSTGLGAARGARSAHASDAEVEELPSAAERPAERPMGRIAITMDLEMSRDYPERGMREWDFEKGNLDDDTKTYAVEAAKIVKQMGGVIHFFCVGRVLEQPNVDWLKLLIDEGHPIGNHTYDHVNVLSRAAEQTQFRFERAPWLVRGKTAEEVIRENIALTTEAMEKRLGIKPNGFRTPGGFHRGLRDREDLQQMLQQLDFDWVSSLYPAHQTGTPREQPSEEVYRDILLAQQRAQPFRYEPTGLLEIPMSPISDVGAFRSNYWKLPWFLRAIRDAAEWAIEHGAVFDFLCHPSCMVVEDPEFETFKMLCRLAQDHGDRARIVGLDQVARSF